MLDKERFVNDLSELVSFESLADRVEVNEKLLDWVESKLDKRIEVKRYENGIARMLVAGVGEDILNPYWGYMVHGDVVAAKPEQFVMKVEGDKLIGRGTYDMKFSIPMGIELMNRIVNDGLDVNMSLIVTTDEEVGGLSGAKYLAEEVGFRPEVLFVPDGGNDFRLVNKSKGVCQLLIEAKGVPSHASRPWNGKNANDLLVRLAGKLLDKYEKNNGRETWETTMNIGQINGGISANQVCPSAIMKLDFRFPETNSIENIVDEVSKMAEKIDGGDVRVSTLSTGLPTYTNEELPIVKKFIEVTESVIERNVVIEGEYGASDARHFAAYGIPTLMMEPLGADLHGDNEWISLSSCVQFFEVLEKFFLNSGE